MRLSQYCDRCNKRLDLVYESAYNGSLTAHVKFYKCGHFTLEEILPTVYPEFETKSLDQSKEARPYQKEFLSFAWAGGYNVLCTDQMGLGKTAEALLALRANYENLTPSLILVKSATIWQWIKEHKTWCDNSLLGVFLVQGTKGYIPPGFKTYVMSMDTFSRLVRVDVTPSGSFKSVGINPQLKALGIKFIIADECHSFKNQDSNRSRALVAFIQTEGIKHKIFLSGTPIKNRADEYFVTLNLLAPDKFPSIEKFRREWLTQDAKGRWSRINPYLEDEFRDEIAPFVIRREVKDVMKDLPPFRRTFELINIEDDKLKKIYNEELNKLQAIVDSKENVSYLEVSDSLATLRRITGIAKVDFTVDYVDTFFDTDGDEAKIAIGIHHHAVRDILFAKFQERFSGSNIRVLKLSGENSAEQKEAIKKEFQKPGRAVLIISMLAGGVGIDGLQVCHDVIGLERQWTSVDEEQFEARFWRSGQTMPVSCEYFIAKGTIDEFFSDMVENKRFIFGKTVSNDWSLLSDPMMLKDLLSQTTRARL